MNIEFSNPEIKFFFSFQCPYSYMTWELLKTLLKTSQKTIAPIEVGLFPAGNTKFHFNDIWGAPRWNRLIEDAAKLDIRMLKPQKYVSSLNVAKAIETYGKTNAEDYISSIFRGVFLAAIDISLPNSVRLHLQSEGFDSSTYALCMEDKTLDAKIVEQQRLWSKVRLRQLPTIEYEGERYSGFMDKGGLERYLRSILD